LGADSWFNDIFLPDAQRILVRAVRAVYPAHRSTIERVKREGPRIWKAPDFIWEQLLRSFSTMGNSRGARLMTEPTLHDGVTYDVLAGLSPARRRTVLRKTLARARQDAGTED
jgi:hypothetical protein